MPQAVLSDELVAEFSHVLPPSLISRTVVAASSQDHDEADVAATARADAAALAAAVVRCSTREAVTA